MAVDVGVGSTEELFVNALVAEEETVSLRVRLEVLVAFKDAEGVFVALGGSCTDAERPGLNVAGTVTVLHSFDAPLSSVLVNTRSNVTE